MVDNLKRLRKKRGCSQTQLVEQIGLHLSHFNRIETGEYTSLDVVQKLAAAFDVTILNLITEENAAEQRV